MLPGVIAWVTAQTQEMPQSVVVGEKPMTVSTGDAIAGDGRGQSFRIDTDPDFALPPVLPEPLRTTDNSHPPEVVGPDEVRKAVRTL
jgi:hypothetical protein